MEKDPHLDATIERMRLDWNARAIENAEYYVYVPDETNASFDESGRRDFEYHIWEFKDLLLDGRPPLKCRVVEIGCGLGRITRGIAEHFGEVHGVDISPEMIARARDRLREYHNVTLHAGSGADLSGLPDNSFDLAFSFIVFQHIPSREVIARYICDTARVLRPGGAFKFQLSGWCASEYRQQPKDSWLGESFSLPETLGMLRDAGLQPLLCEGAGTQYMWMTARKPRDLTAASPELLRRELAERLLWEDNLCRELTRLDAEPPEFTRRISSLEAALAALQHEFDSRTAWAQSLEAELAKARGALAVLEREFESRTAWTQSLEAELAKARDDLAALEREFQSRTTWANALDAELSHTCGRFADLQKAFDERTAWALQLRDLVTELEAKRGK